jgi:hypothetical protein
MPLRLSTDVANLNMRSNNAEAISFPESQKQVGINKSYTDLTQKNETLAKSLEKFQSKPERDKETIEGRRPKQIYSSAVEILDNKGKNDEKQQLQIPSNT